jgi:hypothetical protein
MQRRRITIETFIGRVRTRSYDGIASRAALALLLGVGFYTPASAHCIVGNRFFPATLNIDDPCVNDELALPTIAGFKNGDDPSARELDISGEYSKTITENFGVSFEEAWIHLDIPHEGSAQGFDNLGTSFKYQFVRNAGAERAGRYRSTSTGEGPAARPWTPSPSPRWCRPSSSAKASASCLSR